MIPHYFYPSCAHLCPCICKPLLRGPRRICVQEKAQRKSLAIGSLSQLVSQQSPVMLLAVQENHNADGHYGFTCRHREGGGLVVETVDNSHLCVGDRYGIQMIFFPPVEAVYRW